MQILGFYLQDCRARVSSTRPYSAVQKAQEAAPASARRTSPSTSRTVVPPRSHAAVAAAVANKVAAALSQSERSARPGKAPGVPGQVSPSTSARTNVTRPGRSLFKRLLDASVEGLCEGGCGCTSWQRAFQAPELPATRRRPRAGTVRTSPISASSPRDLTRSTESARRRVAATTAPTTAPHSTRTRMGLRPPVQSYRR
eukprot:g11071.t1